MRTRRPHPARLIAPAALVLVACAGTAIGQSSAQTRAAEPWTPASNPARSSLILDLDYQTARCTSVEQRKLLVVVARAEWSDACLILDQTLLADPTVRRRLTGQALVIDLPVDHEHTDAAAASIDALPTLIAYKHGLEVDRVVGLMSAQDFLTWLNNIEAGHENPSAHIPPLIERLTHVWPPLPTTASLTHQPSAAPHQPTRSDTSSPQTPPVTSKTTQQAAQRRVLPPSNTPLPAPPTSPDRAQQAPSHTSAVTTDVSTRSVNSNPLTYSDAKKPFVHSKPTIPPHTQSSTPLPQLTIQPSRVSAQSVSTSALRTEPVTPYTTAHRIATERIVVDNGSLSVRPPSTDPDYYKAKIIHNTLDRRVDLSRFMPELEPDEPTDSEMTALVRTFNDGQRLLDTSKATPPLTPHPTQTACAPEPLTDTADITRTLAQLRTGARFIQGDDAYDPPSIDPAQRRRIMAALREAERLAATGQHAQAAQQYAWLWEHIPQQTPSLASFRRSLMARAMNELASISHEALALFIELRDTTEHELRTHARSHETNQEQNGKGQRGGDGRGPWEGNGGGWEVLYDWIVLNRVVGREERTLLWIDTISNTQAGLATVSRVEPLVDQLLIEHDRVSDLARISAHPDATVRRQHKRIELLQQLARENGASETELDELRTQDEAAFAAFALAFKAALHDVNRPHAATLAQQTFASLVGPQPLHHTLRTGDTFADVPTDSE